MSKEDLEELIIDFDIYVKHLSYYPTAIMYKKIDQALKELLDLKINEKK